MTVRARGVAILVVHLLLVGSVALKYAWERHTCPRVWTRTAQYDPEQPLRGRYLALTLEASACGLPSGARAQQFGWNTQHEWSAKEAQSWNIQPTSREGQLTGRPLGADQPEKETLTLGNGVPCERGLLSEQTEFFIAEHAQTPFPLAKGQELWAEVTVPPSGPPRPIQLAVSDGKSFHVLALR